MFVVLLCLYFYDLINLLLLIYYDGMKILQRNIIVVTKINYRLNELELGWLCIYLDN